MKTRVGLKYSVNGCKCPGMNMMASDQLQLVLGRFWLIVGGFEWWWLIYGDCRCFVRMVVNSLGCLEMVLGGFRWFSVIYSFSSYGEIRCFKFKSSRQLWGVLVVSSNNDTTYKLSVKKTMREWEKFFLMKVDRYSFMWILLVLTPFLPILE